MARIRHHLVSRCAYPFGERDATVVVGCSGGPDSTALLLALAALASRRRAPGPRPIAVAIHHGLRPEASAECELVSQLAERLGLVFEEVHVRPAARPGNVSDNARHDRYDALAASAQRHGARLVAVGHHALDRLESTLLALARGRGLRGVASPAWSRPLGAGVRLIRPLLATTKAECEALCARFRIPIVSDPTNADPTRARGFLRTEVLPSLLERWPAIERHASTFVDEAALAVRLLDRWATTRMALGTTLPIVIERDRCREVDPTLLLWALRSAAVRAIGDDAIDLPRVTWERIVRAATDARPAPRTFGIGQAHRCRITLASLSIERC